MVWTVLQDYLFNSGGPTSVGGAGTTTGVGQGFEDVAGGTYSLDAAGKLRTTTATSLSQCLFQQDVTVTATDSQFDLWIPQGSDLNYRFGILRMTNHNTGILVGTTGGTNFEVFNYVGGVFGSFWTGVPFSSPLNTSTYGLIFRMNVTGHAPTTATATVLRDDTLATVATATTIDGSFSDTPAAGQFGVLLLPTGTGTLDPVATEFTAYKFTSVIGPGTITLGSTTKTTAVLASFASGGTGGPYTLYRNSTSNFTAPSGGTLVSGFAGTFPYTDTPGGSPGAEWFYL